MRRRIVGAGIIILIVLIAGFAALGRAEDSLATLVVAEGEVTLIQDRFVPSNSPPLTLTTGDIQTVSLGDTIILADGAVAQLHLKDGSTVELYDGASLTVLELDISATTFRVQLELSAGRIVNRVVKLLGFSDSYQVRTPSSTAAVRGTVFSVTVMSPDMTHYAVASGIVEVAMGDQSLLVHAGESVTAVTNQPLRATPASDSPPASTSTPATSFTPDEQTPSPSPVPGISPTAVPSPLPATSAPITPPGPPLAASPTLAATQLPQVTATATPFSTDEQPAPPTLTPPPSGQATVTPPPPATQVATATPRTTIATPTPMPGVATPTPMTDLTTPTPTLVLPTATPLPPTATFTPPPLATSTPLPPTATAVPPTETPSLVTLCHIPGGNPDNAQTIQVPPDAVQAHLDHGDYLGPCQ